MGATRVFLVASTRCVYRQCHKSALFPAGLPAYNVADALSHTHGPHATTRYTLSRYSCPLGPVQYTVRALTCARPWRRRGVYVCSLAQSRHSGRSILFVRRLCPPTHNMRTDLPIYRSSRARASLIIYSPKLRRGPSELNWIQLLAMSGRVRSALFSVLPI